MNVYDVIRRPLITERPCETRAERDSVLKCILKQIKFKLSRLSRPCFGSEFRCKTANFAGKLRCCGIASVDTLRFGRKPTCGWRTDRKSLSMPRSK